MLRDGADVTIKALGANLQLTIEEKQELLEIFDPIDRLTRVAETRSMAAKRPSMIAPVQGPKAAARNRSSRGAAVAP